MELLVLIVVVLDLGEVRVNEIALRAGLCARLTAHVRVALRRLLLVYLTCQIAELLGQAIGRHLNHLGVGTLERFLDLVDLGLYAGLFIGGQLIAQVGQRLFGLEDKLLGVVAHLDRFLVLLILLRVLLGLVHGLVDLVL